MSSSSVYQGLQSCLAPRVIEPRVLRLKLAQPGSNLSPTSEPVESHECEKKDTKTNTGGWSFLQAISNNSTSSSSHHCDKTTEEKVYVHPTVKRSSSLLSQKSLEMCTESLGSETGSNASESSDDSSLFSSESNSNNTFISNYTSVAVPRRVNNRACNFPPPLTSITDLRPHREDGRLILEAIASPSPQPYFRAERSEGRLRICLYESPFDSECDDDDDDDDDEEEEEEVVEDNDDEMQNEEENVEDEIGVNKFGRPSRCKESGNRDIFGDAYFELPSLSLCL